MRIQALFTLKISVLVVIFFFFLSGKSQSIYINLTDGTHVSYGLALVSSITYTQDKMLLNKTDGSTISWKLENVMNYRYENIVNAIKNGVNLIEPHIYPNPTNGNLNLSFELTAADNLTVSVFDKLGRELRTLAVNSLSAGHHQIQLEMNDLSSDVYTLRVCTSNDSFSEFLFIK